MNDEIDPFTGLKLRTIGETAPQRSNKFLAQSDPIAIPTIETPMVATPYLEKPPSFGESLLYGLLGMPDADLSDSERSKDAAKRNDASATASSAAKSPGRAHMGIPSAGGGSGWETFGKLAKLLGGLG
jgi:hypothetical protein